MTTDAPAQLEASTEIDATPAQVWSLVTDLTRMPRWSPMTRRTWVLGGTVRQGAWFVNLNGSGLKRWPTTGRVVRFTPHSDFAFRITENTVVWSYGLEPTAGGGTRLTARRETPDGISALSTVLTKVVLGGVPDFTEELRAGMQQTLERIRAEAER
jgi:uncharacterized protein YndB with AHSA1/START domain